MVRFFIGLWLCLGSAVAVAGVSAEQTRVIMAEGKKEQVLRLKNHNQYPVIVQLWVDDGDINSQPETARSPYMVLPPVFKMQPQALHSVKIVSASQNFPADRESMYWLNIYEIPPVDEQASENTMLITMRTRMKVIHRPKALTQELQHAIAELEYNQNEQSLALTNPTPFYITLQGMKLHTGNGTNTLSGMLLEPFSSTAVALEHSGSVRQIELQWIDDQGLSKQHLIPRS